MSTTSTKNQFTNGLKKGLPICLGYIPVSFTFGIMAVSGGMPPFLAVLISLTNLTSSGQFAGTNLILAGASFFEIALATFVINIRYMLMSLSLSQKMIPETNRFQKMIFSFGITDETFAVASAEPKKISASYMYGLILLPIVGWTFGTLLGAFTSELMPMSLRNVMGIALYAMFIAIIIPPAKKHKEVVFVLLISILISVLLHYVPYLREISPGFRVIIATILGALFGAILFPEKGGDENVANS